MFRRKDKIKSICETELRRRKMEEISMLLCQMDGRITVLATGSALDIEKRYENAKKVYNGTGIELKQVRVSKDIADECLCGDDIKLIEVFNA